jgi:hypothetical protein
MMSTNHVQYLNTNEFVKEGAGVVKFGTAPDGLPMLAKIAPLPQTAELLRSLANTLGIEKANIHGFSNADLKNTPLEPLVDEIEQILKNHLIQRLEIDEGKSLEVFPLPKTIDHYLGPTLLSRFFGYSGLTVSRGIKIDTRNSFMNPPITMTAADRPHPPTLKNTGVPQPKFKVGQTHLALPLDQSLPVIVKRETNRDGYSQFTFVRNYLEESIKQIPQAKLGVFFHEPGTGIHREITLDLAQTEEYLKIKEEMPRAHCSLKVPRNGVAELFIEIAAELSALHERGEIHGDLKFANILLTEQGVRVFDSLGLREGERAPAMTRGWAAPEQVLGNPVAPATDQYAFGLMLLELLEGVLYGEEATVTIPVGGTQLERHTIHRNPGVYIDPDDAPVLPEAVNDWRSLIERCIRFEPEDRFASMDDLIAALKTLSAQNTLSGEFTIPLVFGTCIIGSDEQNDPLPCWLNT